MLKEKRWYWYLKWAAYYCLCFGSAFTVVTGWPPPVIWLALFVIFIPVAWRT